MSNQFEFPHETNVSRVNQFLKYMSKNGYDDLPTIYQYKTYYFSDVAKSENVSFEVNAHLQVFANVPSFLYSRFFSPSRKYMLYSANVLKDFKGRMAYFEWDVVPLFVKMEDIPTRDKVRMMFTVIPFLQEKMKGWGDLSPVGNEPVVGRVAGYKSEAGKDWESMKKGTKQREKMAMRIGFGNTGIDNNCYAYYDENCNIKPIMVDTKQ